MNSVILDTLGKLRQAEGILASLSQEIRTLESERQGHLQEIVRGRQLLTELNQIDRVINEKKIAFSKSKEEVGYLRAQLESQLSAFRKDLLEEKQRALDSYLEQRSGYLKRIEVLELEASKYRYLVTGKKDQRLANVKDLLPSELGMADFVPVDEHIGKIKLQVSTINRMNSEELLKKYLEREKEGD